MQYEDLRELIIGIDENVPGVGGMRRRYINFDNAASTPAVKPVVEKVNEFLRWYSNVHRGTGFKSKLSSWTFDRSREIVAEFVGGNQPERVVLFAKNTTEAINHLAKRFPFRPDGVVLTTVMEHHSNELPWRTVAQVEHVNVLPDGRVDENDFQKKLKQFHGRIQLAAVTGASNVTGFINPIHTYARWVHEAGAQIFVDAAQLAPHRPMDMKNPADPECIDFCAFSAHKMYAPYGVGVLVGLRKMFEVGDPAMVGGGTVDIVNLENAYWADLPDKEEAGTPDIVGAVALASAVKFIQEIGWERIISHETDLTAYVLEKLSGCKNLTVYGDNDSSRAGSRLGVVSFNIRDLPHALVAAILSYEWAIGTRNGCFCAHPYVKSIMHVDEVLAKKMEIEIIGRDRSHLPGTVRISFGIYNTREEIDILCEALQAIAQGNYLSGYRLNKERGEYYRTDVPQDYESYFAV